MSEEKTESVSEAVTLTVDNFIADVRLNRPDKYNALNADVYRGLDRIIKELGTRDDVRVVVLSGNGGNFCAGADLEVISKLSGAKPSSKKAATNSGDKSDSKKAPKELFPRSKSFPNKNQILATGWHDLSVPVIAALEGIVFGAGIQMALGADIRIAKPDAKLSIMETKWGLIPDVGITQTTRHLLPRDVALKLCLTAEVISGTKAKELGLVTELAEEPLAEAMKLAKVIAGKSPDATSLTKALFNYSWEHSIDEGLRMEEELILTLGRESNQLEAVKAQMQKREPDFKPRVVKDITTVDKLLDK